MTRAILACSAALAAVLLGGVGFMAAAVDAACPPAAQVVPRHRVDIDRAGADEIAMLADVGPSLAARIVADRAARGPFASVDDLRRVRGVGQATLDGIRADIRVAAGASPAAIAPSPAASPRSTPHRASPQSRGHR